MAQSKPQTYLPSSLPLPSTLLLLFLRTLWLGMPMEQMRVRNTHLKATATILKSGASSAKTGTPCLLKTSAATRNKKKQRHGTQVYEIYYILFYIYAPRRVERAIV